MKKFKKIFQSVLTELGLIDKAKAQNLSDEDWDRIAQSYKEKTGNDFYNDATMSEEDRQRIEAHDRALQLLDNEDEEPESEDPEQTEEETPVPEGQQKSDKSLPKKVKGLQTKIQNLKKQNRILSRETEPDTVRQERIVIAGLGGAHTPKFAFGIEHPMFDSSKRWNKVAMRQHLNTEPDDEEFASFQTEVKQYGKRVCTRMQELHQMGVLNKSALQQVDYSHLADAGLGEQFVIRRTDALIARIIALPSVFDIFPLRFYVQDKDLITNAFFDEYSQAYQEGEISKGGAELVPEMACVDDAMFKHLFKSMKWIERQYIGYLNTNGSDPTKWGMIEWMILNIATVLNNERNVRAIRGCRVEPEKGKTDIF